MIQMLLFPLLHSHKVWLRIPIHFLWDSWGCRFELLHIYKMMKITHCYITLPRITNLKIYIWVPLTKELLLPLRNHRKLNLYIHQMADLKSWWQIWLRRDSKWGCVFWHYMQVLKHVDRPWKSLTLCCRVRAVFLWEHFCYFQSMQQECLLLVLQYQATEKEEKFCLLFKHWASWYV